MEPKRLRISIGLGVIFGAHSLGGPNRLDMVLELVYGLIFGAVGPAEGTQSGTQTIPIDTGAIWACFADTSKQSKI